MKVFKTESPIPAVLDNLVLGNPAVPDGQDPIEIEVEWKLLQSPPAGVAGNGRENEVNAGQAAADSESVIRRYEFYKYLGPVVPEDGEAQCDNPANCPDAVGDFIGAQNAAVNLAPISYFEETDPAIAYTGTWGLYSCVSCSGGALGYSAQTGASATLAFNGTGFKWIVTKAKVLGKARVTVDGVVMGLVDLYSLAAKTQVVFQKTGLAPGNHTLILEVSGQKNPASIGKAIDVDAFEIAP